MTWGLTPHIDATLVLLYLFWAGFAYLVYYLQREGRREGFPLVADPSGEPLEQSIWMPAPKTFTTNDGRVKQAPDPATADTRDLPLAFIPQGPGSPLVPTTDKPMTAPIGAGAWAERPDIADLTFEGHDRVVPIRVTSDFEISPGDIDPRGVVVYGADDKAAGTVVDVWVDRSEYLIRYLELELNDEAGAPGKRVLLPMNTADVKGHRDFFMEFITTKKTDATPTIHVYAILASQFGDVPTTASPDRVTMLEEEKIQAYYGSGFFFATPDRQEPLI